ncbi:MAG: cobalamin biosynthesis protein CobD [Candidatus Omnitrophica bacterium]|nr:cobalamin biosynthesis protein CobD [Candidatus Omnitrophota bacterium]
MIKYCNFLFAASYAADLVLGDPGWLPHPVRWMGALIKFMDEKLRRGSPQLQRLKGTAMSLTVIGVSAACAFLFITAAGKINPVLGYAAWIYAAYTTLAVKDLGVHAKAVESRLKEGSIEGARAALSSIVSRHTADLDEEKIVVSAVESVAENTGDGIIAPLFYLILGGPVAAVAYKAVSTLDSMVGYKNEKYRYFGWFAARLDDAANFIPARLGGLLISAASSMAGDGFGAAFRVMLADGRKHPSPNSGICEAAMAGALGIRLGGAWSYDGKASVKPFLGKDRRKPAASMIGRAVNISLIASFLMVLTGILYKCLI